MAFKIYTKTGDEGNTGLFGGARLPKNHIRIEAYGSVDELNAHIGMLRDLLNNHEQLTTLEAIQNRLFTIGSNLASDPSKNVITPDLKEEDISLLEHEMDKMDENIPALKHFILPGGHINISQCHIARTVCRRAERCIIGLNAQEPVLPIIIKYINRLSDYLFILGRKVAHDMNIEEVKWVGRT